MIMARHLFLTGDKRVGKSTLLRTWLGQFPCKVGGFRTVRTMEVYGDRFSVHLVAPDGKPSKENQLFLCPPPRDDGEVMARFEELGCAALAGAAECDMILMDELGPTEAKAEKFQQRVLEILDGEVPVVGVIQRAESEFLGRIANHPNVSVIEVTPENRDVLAKRNLRNMDQRNSCGAVVIENGKVLLCQGYRGWSFPKGKIEAGESPEETAIREVWEETSIRIALDADFTEVVPSAKPGDTRTVTFYMGCSLEDMKAPVADEVEYAAWVPVEEALERIKYIPDRDVLVKALKAPRPKVLVSACLLGENCKYNGGNNFDERVAAYLQDKQVIPVCPEKVLGCPRVPMEIRDGILVNREGEIVDTAVRQSVSEILDSIRDEKICCAVLKSRSPTCGVHQVYDGTFTGKLVPGAGVLAQALKDAGIALVDAEDLQ